MSSHDHLCWTNEHWAALDLWQDIPGAMEHFELMLNGGFALLPHEVSVSSSGEQKTMILPLTASVEETIGDTKPIFASHGLWICTSDANYNQFESEFDISADQTVAWYCSEEVSLTSYTLFRPWDALPVSGKDMESINYENEVYLALSMLIDDAKGPAPLQHLVDELNKTAEPLREEMRRVKQQWMDGLERLAKYHQCAEAMFNESSMTVRQVI